MADGSEPVDPEEIIYRRVPASWAGHPFPSPQAFTPREEDADGLSLYRAKYVKTIAEVAYNDRNSQYHVAILRAKDLIAAGIEIVPNPGAAKPGHVHLPGINYTNRKESRVVDLINLLATKLCKTQGPFPSTPHQSQTELPDNG